LTSSGGVNITGGIKMAGTNVSGTAWKIMYGVQTTTNAVGAGAYTVAQTINYGATFSAQPQVFLTVMKNPNNAWTAVSAYFNASVDVIGNSSFTWSVHNSAGGTPAAANSYYINWFAIGKA